MKAKLFYLSIVIFLLFNACGNSGRNYIFVIDTSGSMTYTGRTIDKVKHQMPGLLDLVNNGDSVTLIKFDEKPIVSPTVKIQSEDDKQKILKEIQAIKAEGLYTDMSLLIQTLQEYSEKHADEKSFIVVLSDGIDDPGPKSRKRKPVNLKEYSLDEPGPVKDYFIYYISLGKAKSETLEKGLKSVSAQVKTIESKADHKKDIAAKGKTDKGKRSSDDASDDTSSIGIDEVTADIKYKNLIFSIKDNIYLPFALIGLLLLGLLFFILKLLQRNRKLYGRLVYKAQGMGSIGAVYNLGKVNTGKLVIGANRDCNLRISDIGVPKEFIFKPLRKSGMDYLRPVGKSASLIEFVEQRTRGRISFGDKFRIGNYIFEYNNGNEN